MQGKNIVVATDFSQNSFTVITKALEFAQNNGATLHIVHAVEKGFCSTPKNIETIESTSFGMIQKEFPQIEKMQFHCANGDVEDVISEYSQTLDAVLVILGSNGERNEFKEFFLGSSTKSIVRALEIPCIVIKADTKLEFKDIMVPTDLSNQSKEHIIKLHSLFPNARIKLFYIYIVPFESRLEFYGMKHDEVVSFHNEIRSEARGDAYRFYESLHIDESKLQLVLKEGHLDTEFFLHEAHTMKIDLIALHTTGKVSFFAFDLLEDSDINVLIDKV